MNRDDDGSSMIVRFDSTVKRPIGSRLMIDARLLTVNTPMTWLMNELVGRFQIRRDGRSFGRPPLRDEARKALRSWIDELGAALDENGLHDAAMASVFPVPVHVPHNEVVHFFDRDALPSMHTLIHVLFALGISPHAITGMALILKQAEESHETSDKRHSVRIP